MNSTTIRNENSSINNNARVFIKKTLSPSIETNGHTGLQNS